MTSQTSRQTAAEQGQRTPVGTIYVVDPNPLNWLFITWNTMEEPVRTDERGHIVGAVMEDSRWVDGTTFEIDVRRGVRFQDGEECDAHSVKRAFDEVQRWKAPHPPGTSLNFHPDATAEVVDDHKVRLNFPEPDGLVLGKFRGMHVPSTRFWEEEGFGYRKLGTGEGHWWVIDAPGPWGSGPFTLAEGYSSLENEIAIVGARPLDCVWLDTNQPRTDRLVLEANPDHWNIERGPKLEKVVFRNDVPHDRALELVCDTEGEIDIVTEVDPSDAERVQESEHARLEVVDVMRIVTGVINRSADDVPLDDARTRKALNMAVDRERMVREGFAGYAHPLSGLTPPYAGGFSGAEPYPHDPAEARRLMGEAGWPDGRNLQLAATSNVEPVADALAEDLRDSLGIGVDVTIIPDEKLLAAQHALVEKVMPLPFDVLVHPWIDLSSDAPPAFIHGAYFASDGPFRAGPPIPKFEDLMGRFGAEIDAERQAELATEIDKFVYDEALSVFLVAPQALYAVNRHVDFVGHAATFELAATEVGEEHWSRRNGESGGS